MCLRFVKSFAVASIFTVAASVAYATPIINQNAPTNNAYMAGLGQGDLAQSFQQSVGNIDGAGVFLQAGQGSSGLVTISLYDKLPSNGGSLLASGSAVGSSGSWVDVFWSDVRILAEQTYYLVFTSANNTLGISGDTENGYSRGQVYANSGFASFSGYDYTFRTYAGNGENVPEPGSLALIGLGLAALAGLRRRKSI